MPDETAQPANQPGDMSNPPRIELNQKPTEFIGGAGTEPKAAAAPAAKPIPKTLEEDTEYQELVSSAKQNNAKLATRIGLPEAIKQCDDPLVAGDNTVRIIVPKHFFLTEQDHSKVEFKIGVRKVARRHAEHWWVKNHGCTSAEDMPPATTPKS